MVDHPRMVIDLNDSQICTLEDVCSVLDGAQVREFSSATNAKARCDWILAVLRRLRYAGRKRANRGLVLRYLRRFSILHPGLSAIADYWPH